MNKTELVDAVSNIANTTKAESNRVIEAFIEAITQELKSGGSVSIPGFGTYTVSHRSARTGRNPQTGETIEISAKTVPAFKAGKKLKEAVQEG